jgi:hypothetical protein
MSPYRVLNVLGSENHILPLPHTASAKAMPGKWKMLRYLLN